MERNDKAAIEALLKRHGFHFSKSMGQNFLIDPAIPYEIAESSRANEQNGVLEIGPGIGALSHELCERAGKVVAVELDKTLLPILDETMARFDNFEVVSADILKTDIPALVREKFAGLTPIVCANLPYNITTPAITALIESKCFESITVLVQKEVAERLCAAPRAPTARSPSSCNTTRSRNTFSLCRASASSRSRRSRPPCCAPSCAGSRRSKSRTRSSSSAWCTPRSPCGARRLSTA